MSLSKEVIDIIEDLRGYVAGSGLTYATPMEQEAADAQDAEGFDTMDPLIDDLKYDPQGTPVAGPIHTAGT